MPSNDEGSLVEAPFVDREFTLNHHLASLRAKSINFLNCGNGCAPLKK